MKFEQRLIFQNKERRAHRGPSTYLSSGVTLYLVQGISNEYHEPTRQWRTSFYDYLPTDHSHVTKQPLEAAES